MSKKLYVGNLPYSMREDDLSQLFTGVGEVESVRIITDRQSGRSKGFGFVEMQEEDANKAITELNGKEVDGRAILVNEARENPQRRSNFQRGGRGGDRY